MGVVTACGVVTVLAVDVALALTSAAVPAAAKRLALPILTRKNSLAVTLGRAPLPPGGDSSRMSLSSAKKRGGPAWVPPR